MRLGSDVLAVLAAAETDGNVLRLTGQLDRALYVKVGKAIETAGGKWNRRAQAHVFDGDAAPVIARLLADEQVISHKQATQFFPTPSAVVERLIALAGLKPSHAALEPSAGRGAIAARLVPLVAAVDCIEMDPFNAGILRATCTPPPASVVVADFLAVEPRAVYDRVVMNPPFARHADIAHVTHALRFLRPGGLLVSVMPVSVTFRTDRATAGLRRLAEEAGGSFEPLADGAFTESGTGVGTVIAVIPVPAEAAPAAAEPSAPVQLELFGDAAA